MSKVVKGVSKVLGFKAIVKGVKKTFQAVTKSSFGRLLLIGATIYLGGAAMGMWQSPFASINGALAGGTTAATEGSTAAAGMLDGGADAAGAALNTAGADAAGTAAADATGSALAGGSAATDTAAQLSAASSAAPSIETFTPGATTLGSVGDFSAPSLGGAASAGTGATGGLIGNAASGSSWFSSLSPIAQYGLIQTGAGALQGAFTPNALDVEKQRAQDERDNLAWRNQFLAPNFNVGNLNLGAPSGQPLRDMNGNPVYPNMPQTPQPASVGFIKNAMG